jgi:hypothetical protein
MPVIAVSVLKKVWRRNGEAYTPGWFKELEDICDVESKILRHEPSIDSAQGQTTIMLLSEKPRHSTPRITLTSPSTPIIHLTTWHTLDQPEWTTTAVLITLRPKLSQKTHTRNNDCVRCQHAAKMNRNWRERMTGVRYPMWDFVGYWKDRGKWEERMQALERDEEEIERVEKELSGGGVVKFWMEKEKEKRLGWNGLLKRKKKPPSKGDDESKTDLVKWDWRVDSVSRRWRGKFSGLRLAGRASNSLRELKKSYESWQARDGEWFTVEPPSESPSSPAYSM